MCSSHFVRNYFVFDCSNTRIVLSGTWAVIPVMIFRSSSNSYALGIGSESFWRIVFTRTWLIKHFFSHNICSVALTHLVRNYSIFHYVSIAFVISGTWYITFRHIFWPASHHKLNTIKTIGLTYRFSIFTELVIFTVLSWSWHLSHLLRNHFISH